MGGRINTVMQVCFFAISGVLPRQDAIDAIKHSIEKTYARKGEEIIAMNLKAVDNTLENLYEVAVPQTVTSKLVLGEVVPASAPEFVRDVLGAMIARRGDYLPVSAMPVDGTYPSGKPSTKNAIWRPKSRMDPAICIQCSKCALVCPHAVIRIKALSRQCWRSAGNFKHVPAKETDGRGWNTPFRFRRKTAPARHLRGCLPGQE